MTWGRWPETALLPLLLLMIASPARGSVAVRGDHLDEGFESPGFPPPGWSQAGNGSLPAANRWHTTTEPAFVFVGDQAARVQWQDQGNQNERIHSPRLDLSAAGGSVYLSFWWYGNPFWASSADLIASASADSSTWTEVWKMSDQAEVTWAWRQVVVDVSSYVGGDLVVRFRYTGRNGADVAVDEVKVGGMAPTPPVNDDCAGALASGATIGPATGSFSIDADNSLATPDYPLPPTGCTGYSHTGQDLVWVVDVPAGYAFTATMTTAGSWDDTLFLIGDCGDPEGTCVSGDNAIPDGSSVSVFAPGPGIARYYLVASGYAAGSGPFSLTGDISLPVATEPTSWGRIKAGYR